MFDGKGLTNIFENETFGLIRNSREILRIYLKKTFCVPIEIFMGHSVPRWHERLGHVDLKSISSMLKKNVERAVNLDDVLETGDQVCLCYIAGKDHVLSCGDTSWQDISCNWYSFTIVVL